MADKDRKKKTFNTLMNITMIRVRVAVVTEQKQEDITYSEYVSVAFVTQHAKRMLRIVIYSLSGCVICFSTFPHKRHDLKKKCVFTFSTTFVQNIFHFNTLRTGDADLRFYITTVQDG